MRTLGKLAYGLLFCAVLPLALLAWAWATEERVHLSVNGEWWQVVGAVATILGAVLVIWAMFDLWRFGKGLPMNAFPPEHYVIRGAYALFRHPIYLGACLMCLGVSLYANSSAGPFLITPIFCIGCWALVQGYEASAIRARFGEAAHAAVLSPPAATDQRATWIERWGVAVLVFVPWLIGYELLITLGPDPNALDTFLPFERSITVVPWAELVYACTYLFVGLVPFLMRSRRQLRAFAKDALWAVALGLFLQAVLPLKAMPIAMHTSDPLSKMIHWERAMDGPSAAFPSFHVIWAFIAAWAYRRAWPWLTWLWMIMAFAIAWSCWAVGAHSILDILGGAATFLVVIGRTRSWHGLQRASEYLANSWQEWHIGPVRIISHSVFAALGGAVCLLAAVFFGADPRAILLTGTCGLLVAALWGQLIEGSPRLLRPYGFYGSVFGVVIGAFITQYLIDEPVHRTLTALALAAPWMQATGRLRCLVQGCCHGRVQERGRGIRYTNPHTRVHGISGLAGMAIHNTQLYSIIGNLCIGLVLWRMAWSGAEITLIIGVYLMLGSLARFVEEHYRGESQTVVRAGLRLYQWIAVLGVVAGIIVSCVPSAPFAFGAGLDHTIWIYALAAGVIAGIAMGVDLPRSNMRFSRLSG